jgi:hypothetical protein
MQNREHNATSAHIDLMALAARTQIGAHFHKPAPIRVRKPGPILSFLYGLLGVAV